ATSADNSAVTSKHISGSSAGSREPESTGGAAGDDDAAGVSDFLGRPAPSGTNRPAESNCGAPSFNRNFTGWNSTPRESFTPANGFSISAGACAAAGAGAAGGASGASCDGGGVGA